MMKKKIGQLWILLCGTAGVVGCASTMEVNHSSETGDMRPARIYVMNFEVEQPEGKLEISNEAYDKFRFQLGEAVAGALVKEFNEKLGPTARLYPNDPLPPGNAWVVKGRVVKVGGQNRTLRLFMGWDQEGYPLHVEVALYHAMKSMESPFYTFEADGSMIQDGDRGFSLRPAIGLSNNQAFFQEIEGLSRSVAGSVSNYMWKQGWSVKPEKSFERHTHLRDAVAERKRKLDELSLDTIRLLGLGTEVW